MADYLTYNITRNAENNVKVCNSKVRTGVKATVYETTNISIRRCEKNAVHSYEEIVNTLAKVKGLIPAEQIRDIELKSSQINIDLTPWAGNKNLQPNLEEIKRSLNEKIDYFVLSIPPVTVKKATVELSPINLF